MLRHLYDTPTFKTNMLHLASNEGRLKHLLLLYKWLTQPCLGGYNWRRILPFSIRTTHPPLKTEALCLVSNKGRVIRLFLK